MRQIDRVILHCSATKPGHDVTAADIRTWHLARGFADIGYHYVLRLDGTIESGRPITRQGAHTKGHNADSIGICYVGGLDEHGRPCNTMTAEQRRSLRTLCRALVSVLNKPLALHGHNEFSQKACPSFAISDEWPKLRRWMAGGQGVDCN